MAVCMFDKQCHACPQVPLFGPLSPSQRSQLCTALKPLHARAGTVVVQAGDVGNTFYIVEAGTCVVQGANGQVGTSAPSSPLRMLWLMTISS